MSFLKSCTLHAHLGDTGIWLYIALCTPTYTQFLHMTPCTPAHTHSPCIMWLYLHLHTQHLYTVSCTPTLHTVPAHGSMNICTHVVSAHGFMHTCICTAPVCTHMHRGADPFLMHLATYPPHAVSCTSTCLLHPKHTKMGVNP